MQRYGSFLIATLALMTSVVMAQEAPWHLGVNRPKQPAPSAINTSSVKPGLNTIVVAVIDSGVIAEHPSLAGVLLPGYDMLSAPNNLRGGRSPNFSPDEREARCGNKLMSAAFRTHGTEVASLVAGNGADGVFGVNTAARVLPVRLFGACGMSRKDLLDAIAWSAGLPVAGIPTNPNPARIINLSLAGGSPVCGPDLQQLIQTLIDRKIFIVAAAGNNFQKPLPEPANCQGVISVGAVDAENRIEVYSALDKRTVVYAPGGGKKLSSDEPWGVNKLKIATYDLDFFGAERPLTEFRGVGTSFAAPVVSGFVSLWLSQRPDKSPADFWQELPKFLRNVQQSDKCPDCTPKGLAANTAMLQP
jgi:serine protease